MGEKERERGGRRRWAMVFCFMTAVYKDTKFALALVALGLGL